MKKVSPIDVLVIGNGAREHAIAWKFSTSPSIGRLYVAPGNIGTAGIAVNVDVDVNDIRALLAIALKFQVHITFVGPEIPLALGIVDLFQEHGLNIVGPTRAAAQIESSKSFAKHIMKLAGVPTASYKQFSCAKKALEWGKNASYPLVVKADGLAAGKGVIIAGDYREFADAVDITLSQMKFGKASEMILVEDFLIGTEVSVFGFVDGSNISALTAAKDYKRAYDDDFGPNTGGMGSYSAPEYWSNELAMEIRETIFRPIVTTMREENIPFVGILYAGMMMTSDGLKVLEFNCRLGDPEAQVILMRLESDLISICYKLLNESLTEQDVLWSESSAVGVVVAAKGYPDKYKIGFSLDPSLDKIQNAMVFHGGTAMDHGRIIGNGGRLFTVVGINNSLNIARETVYKALENVECEEVFYRLDIANS
tara:strand:+ start:872 stop:2143 length:1272 start_codon:yes stop_codon:yes gene_type:complete